MTGPTLKGVEVLIVEDEPFARMQLQRRLEAEGAEVSVASCLAEARNLLVSQPFDVGLLDLQLPDGDGRSLLREGDYAERCLWLVMTAMADVDVAVEAMRLGARDFLAKPVEFAALRLVLLRMLQQSRQDRIADHRKREADQDAEFCFGQRLTAARSILDRILQTESRLQGRLPPVLITGETGTGKTSLARWLHARSRRAGAVFLEVNASTLPESLAESELFGHEKGAFTDARSARMGLFEAASGGTLFLDELPSLSLALQAKLLTVIEDGVIRRVGATKVTQTDVRLIVSSNEDLSEAVQAGRFREDLFHRLTLLKVDLPPLREHREHIPELADFLLQRLARKYRRGRAKIGAEGRERLRACSWPGNVRELSHEIERALLLSDADLLTFDHLAMEPPVQDSTATEVSWIHPNWSLREGEFSLEAANQYFIRLALQQTDHNVSAAARLLGVTREFVRYHRKKMGLESQ